MRRHLFLRATGGLPLLLSHELRAGFLLAPAPLGPRPGPQHPCRIGFSMVASGTGPKRCLASARAPQRTHTRSRRPPHCTCSWARDPEDRPGSIRHFRPCAADTQRPRSARPSSSEERIARPPVSHLNGPCHLSQRAPGHFSVATRHRTGRQQELGPIKACRAPGLASPKPERAWKGPDLGAPVQSGLPAGEPPPSPQFNPR